MSPRWRMTMRAPNGGRRPRACTDDPATPPPGTGGVSYTGGYPRIPAAFTRQELSVNTFTCPVPVMRPMGVPLNADAVQDVWNTYVVPGQADDAPPQSVEMRALMAILRAVHKGLSDAEAKLHTTAAGQS